MDIQKYIRTNDDGSTEIDKDGFQSELDAEISRAVEKFKNGKGKDEIRKQLEDEAKLTAEQKLKQERDAFEQYKLQSKIELNQAKAKARMEGKNFSEKEAEFILSTINDDEGISLAKVDELIKEREVMIENTRKSAIEGLQQRQTRVETFVNNPDSSSDNSNTQQSWSREQILGTYKKQQN